jgi:hypothetical protein
MVLDKLGGVHDPLALAIEIGALIVGAWCFVAVARNRWIDVTHLVGLALVEGALLVQAALALAAIGSGQRPGEFVTFIGYLVTSILAVPAVVGLAVMERTRWGAVIAGAGAFVAAILTYRLQQVWAT